MLQELGWDDLQSRRHQNKVIIMNRIANKLVIEIPADRYLTAAGASTRGSSTTIPFTNCLQVMQSVSGIVYLRVLYQRHLWMTSSVLVYQDRDCEQHAFN